MNTLPLAKREIHALKWVTLFVLIIEMVMLLVFDSSMAGRVGGASIMSLNMYQHQYSPFFGFLPDASFLTSAAAAVLAFVQFYGINQMFLFSLPVHKNDLLKTKLLIGVCSYTLWILAYGAGLMTIFTRNKYWLEDLYVYFPEEFYEKFLQGNGAGLISQYLLILWLAVTAMYALCVFFQIALKNKIAAGILSFLALWYPAFLRGSLSSGLSRFYDNHHLWHGRYYDVFQKITDSILSVSLPDLSYFYYDPLRVLFVSLADKWEEFAFIAGLHVLNLSIFKILFAFALIALFARLAFKYFAPGRTDEKKTVRRFIAAGGFAIFLLILCNVLPYIRLNIAVEDEEVISENEQIPVNLEKALDTRKLDAYANLNDLLSEFLEYSSEEEREEAKQREFRFFNLETLRYHNIYKNGDGLSFSFEADDFLSKTDIPEVLEEEGFQGLKEFIVRSERHFKERAVPEQTWYAAFPYFYYEGNTKTAIVYNITTHSYEKEISNVSLHINFRAALSYPDKYMELIQGLENSDNYFSQYFVGGHKDMLVFENPIYIAYFAGSRYYSREEGQLLPEYPLKTWLYGKDGVIDSIKIAVVVSRDWEVENQELMSVDAFLDILGESRNDKATIKEAIKNAVQGAPGGIKKEQLENCSFELRTATLQQDYRLVEIVVCAS